MRPTDLGVHLIVRDEAEWLPQCLESVKGADEIIVVDTGSRDDSVKIAQAFGAKVIHHPWEDDFSKARNAALRHATTSWILYLDADECLLGGVKAVKELLASSSAEAYNVTIENILGSRPEDRLYHTSIRLFRNRPQYAFSGRIHEQIGASIVRHAPTSAIADSRVVIRHYGYSPVLLQKKNKPARNESLLLQALQEHPGDPFYLYSLGVAYCQLRRLEEAVSVMRQALSSAPVKAAYRSSIVRDLGKILVELGEVKQAETLIASELETHYADYADLHVLLGHALEKQGWLEDAYACFQKAASLTASSHRYVRDAGSNTYIPLSRMGEIARRLGRTEDAARLFYQALQHHKTYAPALTGIAESFSLLEVPDHQIAALLLQIVSPRRPEDYGPVVEALDAIGADEEIIRLWQPSMAAFSQLLIPYASALIRCRKVAEANVLLAAFPAETRPDAEQPNPIALLRSICRAQEEHDEGDSGGDGILRNGVPGDAGPVDGLPEEGAPDSHADSDGAYCCLLVRRAVNLNAFAAAERFARLHPDGPLALAKALYLEGHTLEAANRLLRLLEQEQADAEAIFFLGEMLYDKGHYRQAAELFERALERDPAFRRADIGLSTCLLQLAAADMEEAILRGAEQSGLKEDGQRIQSAIQLLNRMEWHTEWRGRQRRVRCGQTDHFAVHDRAQ